MLYNTESMEFLYMNLVYDINQGSEGERTVTLTTAEMTAISNGSFTYSSTLTALITSVSPQTTTVFGKILIFINLVDSFTQFRADIFTSLFIPWEFNL